MQRPGITSAIGGASSAAQLRTNLAAAACTLDPALLAELDRIFPAPHTRWWRRLLRRLRGLA
jgi:aryl-alcohol dehydrogenase-like predicted oxidoreductase